MARLRVVVLACTISIITIDDRNSGFYLRVQALHLGEYVDTRERSLMLGHCAFAAVVLSPLSLTRLWPIPRKLSFLETSRIPLPRAGGCKFAVSFGMVTPKHKITTRAFGQVTGAPSWHVDNRSSAPGRPRVTATWQKMALSLKTLCALMLWYLPGTP